MSAALDVLVVVAARGPTELLLALATGSDAAHAPVWAFEVTGDVISAGEPDGHMSVRKITDNGGLFCAVRDGLCGCILEIIEKEWDVNNYCQLAYALGGFELSCYSTLL